MTSSFDWLLCTTVLYSVTPGVLFQTPPHLEYSVTEIGQDRINRNGLGLGLYIEFLPRIYECLGFIPSSTKIVDSHSIT